MTDHCFYADPDAPAVAAAAAVVQARQSKMIWTSTTTVHKLYWHVLSKEPLVALKDLLGWSLVYQVALCKLPATRMLKIWFAE
eukprot:1159646-Pelagomonas_calceolata.AAC.6